ncbi:hypothetical protein FHG64_11845 [Antarcticibacterium flavum]|uniref:Uncharacterized protein n=1 Tax=Antarcticibacterium flavum TaxID=2058175 RepID=A0A5B7X4M6_9FLAO|nr:MULTISPECIES: hypothetical protein [Antarcticibacterium]MCM4161853.1 hypothetical protein [Antarcticibacterium sp. W02-3]QCY70035.1 hypothetical protein FHG64_11845 [Antarcticibacterium flavum]
MKIRTRNKSNWYDSRSLVEILLFMLPPLGLYALYRNNSIRSQNIRILYATIGILTGVFMLMILFNNFSKLSTPFLSY